MAEDTKEMMHPVICTHCGQRYDLCAVEVIHRYADCTLYKSPCCGRTVDDRKWKSLPDFREIARRNPDDGYTDDGEFYPFSRP